MFRGSGFRGSGFRGSGFRGLGFRSFELHLDPAVPLLLQALAWQADQWDG